MKKPFGKTLETQQYELENRSGAFLLLMYTETNALKWRGDFPLGPLATGLRRRVEVFAALHENQKRLYVKEKCLRSPLSPRSIPTRAGSLRGRGNGH
jgi:hypothetical protein